ncbi:MAG: hypothetical protein Q9170_005712 [Blastenia crenularia]
MSSYAPPSGPPPPRVPEGWKAQWNDQYHEWFVPLPLSTSKAIKTNFQLGKVLPRLPLFPLRSLGPSALLRWRRHNSPRKEWGVSYNESLPHPRRWR